MKFKHIMYAHEVIMQNLIFKKHAKHIMKVPQRRHLRHTRSTNLTFPHPNPSPNYIGVEVRTKVCNAFTPVQRNLVSTIMSVYRSMVTQLGWGENDTSQQKVVTKRYHRGKQW